MSLRLLGLAVCWSLTLGLSVAMAQQDPAPAATEKPEEEKPAAEKTTEEKPATEKPAAEAPASESPAKTTADPQQMADAKASFDKIVTQWKEGLKELALLQEGYRKADPAKQGQMEADFLAKRKSLNDTVKPQLIEAATKLYRLEGKDNKDLQGFLRHVLLEKFAQDRWQQLQDLTQLLKESGVDEPQLDLFDAIAAYGLNQFDVAKENIAKAAEAGLLQPPMSEGETPELVQRRIDIGRQIQETVDDYQEFWKAEQAFRDKEAQADDLPRVKLETTKGDIVLELFENEAPNTVANMISLVEAGYYDGIAFHRVLPGFMAQGGDPKGDGTGGPGYRIRCECYEEPFRRHFTGSLSMAKTAARDTGGSQFFLTFRPTPHLNGAHTVFGRVIEGLDVLSDLQRIDPSGMGAQPAPDKIIKATVVRKRDHAYKPEVLPE